MSSQSHGNRWFFQALGEKDCPHKCHVIIPDTLIFNGGEFQGWFYNDPKQLNAIVRRGKKEAAAPMASFARFLRENCTHQALVGIIKFQDKAKPTVMMARDEFNKFWSKLNNVSATATQALSGGRATFFLL